MPGDLVELGQFDVDQYRPVVPRDLRRGTGRRQIRVVRRGDLRHSGHRADVGGRGEYRVVHRGSRRVDPVDHRSHRGALAAGVGEHLVGLNGFQRAGAAATGQPVEHRPDRQHAPADGEQPDRQYPPPAPEAPAPQRCDEPLRHLAASPFAPIGPWRQPPGRPPLAAIRSAPQPTLTTSPDQRLRGYL